jgi:hypothetical protein
MTLIITVTMADKVVQASDLRLTRLGKGEPQTLDNAVKQAFVRCQNADFTIAYTGITDMDRPKRRTDRLLLDQLAHISAGYLDLDKILKELIEIVGPGIVALSNAEQKKKGLTFILGGYLGTDPFMAAVSNFEDLKNGTKGPVRRKFEGELLRMKAGIDPSEFFGISVFGMEEATDNERIDELLHNTFFHQSNGQTIANELVKMIRTAADNQKYGRYVGRNCVSISLSSNPTEQVWGESHPYSSSAPALFPHAIIHGLNYKDIEMYHDHGQGPPSWWKK